MEIEKKYWANVLARNKDEKRFNTILTKQGHKFYGFIKVLSDEVVILQNDKNPLLESAVNLSEISVVMSSVPDEDKEDKTIWLKNSEPKVQDDKATD